MSAREYLEGLKHLDRAVNFKLEQIQMLKIRAEKCTSVLRKDCISGTRFVDPMKVIDKFVDLENSLAQDIGAMLAKQAEITARIDALDNKLFRDILTARYINFKSLEEISVQMSYYYRHTQRLHKESLQYFEKKYPDVTKR